MKLSFGMRLRRASLEPVAIHPNMAATATRADRKLRDAGNAMAGGAAVGDASAEHHDETAGECHRRAARQAVEANGLFPDGPDI